jgi:predicted nucleotidyltransferase
MRLTFKERETIVNEAERCFGSGTSVVLFGSRTDDSRRGGDIDLLIQGTWEEADAFNRKIQFLVGIKAKLGEQHVDVVLAPPRDRRPIVQEATRTGVKL